jgi:hypothetical protein
VRNLLERGSITNNEEEVVGRKKKRNNAGGKWSIYIACQISKAVNSRSRLPLHSLPLGWLAITGLGARLWGII